MDSFINLAQAMLVAIALVYLLIVILVRLLLVTGRVLDLSALIGLLMLRGIVGTNAIVLLDLAVATNAIVLLDLAQHKIEPGEDVRTALIQGGRTWKRPMLMTAAATILALVPLALSSDDGLIAASLATVVIGSLLSSTLLTVVVIPVIYLWLRRRLRHDADHHSRATDWRRRRYRCKGEPSCGGCER